MDKTMKIQSQIRQNAEEVSTYLSEMSKWEKQIKTKDTKIKTSKGKGVRAASVRSGAGTVTTVAAPAAPGIVAEAPRNISSVTTREVGGVEHLTPSSLAGNIGVPDVAKPVAAARGVYVNKDSEEAQRERGNTEYKSGNFAAAVKSYTVCLGLKTNNYVAFANRAMAYIKLKEFHRAIVRFISSFFCLQCFPLFYID